LPLILKNAFEIAFPANRKLYFHVGSYIIRMYYFVPFSRQGFSKKMLLRNRISCYVKTN